LGTRNGVRLSGYSLEASPYIVDVSNLKVNQPVDSPLAQTTQRLESTGSSMLKAMKKIMTQNYACIQTNQVV
jgi:hypothetical protein